MPTYTNGVLRLRPRINVTRGYTGNEPGNITLSTALDGTTLDNASLAKTVFSGQPLLISTTGKWSLAGAAADDGEKLYFAYHDSTDTDVESCGKLLGFSALGNFEIETPWVDVTGLVVGDTLGTGQITSEGTLYPVLKKVTTAGKICGVVTEIRDLGVGGHLALGTSPSAPVTSVTQRGGAASSTNGTIPEDSTSAVYDTLVAGSGAAAEKIGMKIVKFVTHVA